MNDNQLTPLLEKAADGKEIDLTRFYEKLLDSPVYLVMRIGFNKDSVRRAPVIGESHLASLGFLTIQYEGTEALPIFTEESFALAWAEAEVSIEKHQFSKLLTLVGDNWMYLNPGQDVGKEITQWEIEQLRNGPQGISDLVQELLEGEMGSSFEIRPGSDSFPGFTEKLQSVFELCPELQEAYFAAMFEDDSQSPIPTLGLKYGEIKKDKQEYMREELKQFSEDLLPNHTQLFLVDDLSNKQSPNWRLFEDIKPFFVSANASSPPSNKSKNKASSIFARVKRLFFPVD